MTTPCVSLTNCLICNITFQSGTGILLLNVGHFCSQECFNHIPTHPTHKIIMFGPTIFDGSTPSPVAPRNLPKIAPKPCKTSIVKSGFSSIIEELKARQGNSPDVVQHQASPAQASPAQASPAQASPAPVVQAPVVQAPIVQHQASPVPVFVQVQNKLVPIVPSSDQNQVRPNNVIVQRFPTDLIPPPQVHVTISSPNPAPTTKPNQKHSDITPELGICTFCEQTQTLTCQNAAGQKFCRVDLLNRYGNGFGHALAKQNPTYIHGLGLFDSHMRYAFPYVYIK